MVLSIVDDGSCEFPPVGYDCNGNCLEDVDGDGICNEDDVFPNNGFEWL